MVIRRSPTPSGLAGSLPDQRHPFHRVGLHQRLREGCQPASRL